MKAKTPIKYVKFFSLEDGPIIAISQSDAARVLMQLGASVFEQPGDGDEWGQTGYRHHRS